METKRRKSYFEEKLLNTKLQLKRIIETRESLKKEEKELKANLEYYELNVNLEKNATKVIFK